MKQFYLHKEVFFFSGASYGNIPQLECCTEGLSKEVDKTPEGERRFDGQIIPRIRIRPAHKNDGLEDAELPPSSTIPSTRKSFMWMKKKEMWAFYMTTDTALPFYEEVILCLLALNRNQIQVPPLIITMWLPPVC